MADRGKELAIVMSGREAGTVTEGTDGRCSLTYNAAWREDPIGQPISLSMPLHTRSHTDDVVRPYLWGLLPDSEPVLERWSRTYHVSARNPFALLRHVGEDCAGAAQFASPDRVPDLLAGAGGADPIDRAEIARRIRLLRRDPAAWHAGRNPSPYGQFSLAGAQAKTALRYDREKGIWGDPWGAAATTHIIKPAVTGFDDHDLNEHLCLETARRLGIPAARTRIEVFENERAIVVERYDRLTGADDVPIRVHQEDLCQALGVMPGAKYQNEGGPSPEQIIGLLRTATGSDDAPMCFVDALAFNWMIAGTDAHAKNYSVLITNRQVRLAPLYDVSSALPYDEMYLPKLRMAMRIGGEYRVAALGHRHWRRFAEQNDLPPDVVLARIRDLAARLPDALAGSVGNPAVQTLGSDLPVRLHERIVKWTESCRTRLSA